MTPIYAPWGMLPSAHRPDPVSTSLRVSGDRLSVSLAPMHRFSEVQIPSGDAGFRAWGPKFGHWVTLGKSLTLPGSLSPHLSNEGAELHCMKSSRP